MRNGITKVYIPIEDNLSVIDQVYRLLCRCKQITDDFYRAAVKDLKKEDRIAKLNEYLGKEKYITLVAQDGGIELWQERFSRNSFDSNEMQLTNFADIKDWIESKS